ncbi:hypothetical protein P171DRAFT_449885 [Karstenula rhodostoma CBS 690.94]|uniref:Uncharacterized protein n=1 Tax=Karstenula rhodostoma CBS 690.94 TaxID=1392251 RepID=A0A9P4P5H9_9PLEO|nr:hypothetical protein P171DRAFT_449885 [Karstenula rhodostoma CBS 690.94]
MYAGQLFAFAAAYGVMVRGSYEFLGAGAPFQAGSAAVTAMDVAIHRNSVSMFSSSDLTDRAKHPPSSTTILVVLVTSKLSDPAAASSALERVPSPGGRIVDNTAISNVTGDECPLVCISGRVEATALSTIRWEKEAPVDKRYTTYWREILEDGL